MDHIRQFGIQQPIVLMPHAELPEHFYILGGHRRMAAATMLELATVPCTIEHPQTDADAALLLVGLNFQRDKTMRQKANEFMTLEHLENGSLFGLDRQPKNGETEAESPENKDSDKILLKLSKTEKIEVVLDRIAQRIGSTYRDARRMYVVFGDGYRHRQMATLQKKKAKQINIDQLWVNWQALREQCMSETIGLYAAEQELYAQLKRAQRRKDKPEAQPTPPRVKPTLLHPFSGELENEISTFTADDLRITFGTVFHDMEVRPAIKVAGNTLLLDIRALHTLHVKPMMKKEVAQ